MDADAELAHNQQLMKDNDAINEVRSRPSSRHRASFTNPPQRIVLMFRHRIQKGFHLPGGGTLKDDDMPILSRYLRSLEEFQDMTAHILRTVKIHKVMKHLIRLDPKTIPREAEFKFLERARALLVKYEVMLAEDADEAILAATLDKTLVIEEDKDVENVVLSQREIKSGNEKGQFPEDRWVWIESDSCEIGWDTETFCETPAEPTPSAEVGEYMGVEALV